MLFRVLLAGQLTWSIPLLTALVGIAVLYVFLRRRLTTRKRDDLQPLFFFTGLGLLYLMIGSPLSSISHLSFSLHMVQMSMLYFIIPPLILLGIPTNVYTRIITFHWIKKCKNLLFPKIALYTFAILFLIYHLPVTLTIFSQSSLIQNGYLIMLFGLSFGMWWPIVSPEWEQRFNKEQKKRYALLSGMVLMPACLLFIVNALLDGGNNPFVTQITSHLCTPAQSGTFTVLPPPFNTTFDQLLAGIFMLGMHKFGLVLTFKLGNKVIEQPES
ncbi:hypothetical protein CFK37_18760 [Virgibacillus phasianinus]|uniref:Cytochrome c oxidase assembly factor CtaG n=1 Tax=Virgibacillus phasianinus TaxID=2017483 RepID=A0A220U860_9BACI|nr:cytochrome c oxidase assembly protein [Virgibacillus phasianinus]ASK64051.1 hypothetical protein CFK37_18760 [Virgibacillus phasianinus]